MSSVPSWLWPAAGWVLLACGAYLLLLGRVRLTKRRGRLCRGCGYDMAGLMSLQCPECGRVAKSERELQRRPLRLALRLCGVVLLLAAPVVPRTPEIRSHGWVGGVPDWVLAAVAPRKDPWLAWLETPGEYQPPSSASSWWEKRVTRALFAEMERRLDLDDISGRAGAFYLRRVHRDELADIESMVHVPAYWPAREGFVPVVYGRERFLRLGVRYGPRAIRAELTRVDEPAGIVAGELRANLRFRVDPLASFTRKVDFSYTADELLERVSSAELDAAVGTAVGPTIAITGNKAYLVLFHSDDRSSLPCFVTYKATLIVDGTPLASCSGIMLPNGLTADPVRYPLGSSLVQLLTAEHRITVELRSEPEKAMALYRDWWTLDWSGARPKVWNGTVRVEPGIERYVEPGHTAKPPVNLVEPSR